jgi:hypothetical protein
MVNQLLVVDRPTSASAFAGHLREGSAKQEAVFDFHHPA